MPFQSQAQRRFMFARHPKVAKRWAKKYGGGGKNLPEKKGRQSAASTLNQARLKVSMKRLRKGR